MAIISESNAKWEVQVRKGCIELAILATLWQGRLYGLEMVRRLDLSGLAVPEGTIYPLLGRLQTARLVDAEWEDAAAGRPRKYYFLTADGRCRVQEMSILWASFTANIDHLLEPLLVELSAGV